jgi:hypothetical protein
MVFATQITLTAGTTTALVAAGPVLSVQYYIANPSAVALFVGGTPVTSTGGCPVAAGSSVSLRLKPGENVYGLAIGGTVDARILAVTGSR